MFTLKAIAILSFLPDDIEHGVNELSSFRVVTFRPVITCPGLPEDEVIWAEDLTERPGANAVHGSRLEIHEHSAWNESSAAGLIVVYVDALELQIGVAVVATGGVDAVFGADYFPELGSDLVAALAALDVEDFTHFLERGEKER